MVMGRNGMGRNGYGPKWSWAEMVMGRNDPEPKHPDTPKGTFLSLFSYTLARQWIEMTFICVAAVAALQNCDDLLKNVNF